MEKTPMPLAQAREEATMATQGIINTLKEQGHPIEVGQVDGDGRRFTERRVKGIRRRMDQAYLTALREKYRFVRT